MDIDFLAQLYEEEEKENAEPLLAIPRPTSKSPPRDNKPYCSQEMKGKCPVMPSSPIPVYQKRPQQEVFDHQKWKAYVQKLRSQLYLKKELQLPSTLLGLEKQSDMIQGKKGRAFVQIYLTMSSISHEWTRLALLERTIFAGENQSAVVVGPEGVGKKLAVRHALEQLSKTSPKKFDIVHLDGAMIHSEIAAFKLVMTQLCTGGIVPWNGTCYEHMYAFLRQTLKEHRLLGISSIFICDNFDQLLRTSKQILLYKTVFLHKKIP